MAFWGIEVKPGKPITHSCEKATGRLRISQATLGISTATKTSIVQCNVGKRRPVLLCALLPNRTESCHLDLEFEEADDVVFSVIGPRSVYLTGYYVRQIHQSNNAQSDSESFGMDIQNSQTEGSSYGSDDDKYEDSFIDDDEVQVSPPSPVSSSEAMDETTPKKDKSKDKKGRGKRLKKKYQVSESDNDSTSKDSDGEDGWLLSVFKTKKGAEKTTVSNVGEKIAEVKVEMGDKSKDDGICGSKSEDKAHPLDINGKPESEKPKKKRKERSKKEEKTSEVVIDKALNTLREHKEHEVEDSAKRENGVIDLVPGPTPESGSNGKKSKKRRKELQLNGESREQQIDDNICMKPELVASDSKDEKKTKTKTKKTTLDKGDSNMGLPIMTDNQENTIMKNENQTANAMPIQKRTLSNGLIIEDVVNGPPDGKVAAPGKKVKIYYTAMLKENGKIFDSNVGKSAYKFRLGDEEVIDGWNVGIDGMHVGDKRRLVIPPSMGFGKHGVEENVPPNSWLVYDVELVGVRK